MKIKSENFMKQFIIVLRYLVPIETVDQHVTAHREYLSKGYEQKYYSHPDHKNLEPEGFSLREQSPAMKWNFSVTKILFIATALRNIKS